MNNMATLQPMSIDSNLFVNKSTVLFGESGSGKTTIIIDILNSLREHIDQILVFCPTDSSHRTYSGGLIPRPFIHSEVTEHLLNLVWERQEWLTQKYQSVNSLESLKSLFDKIANQPSKTVMSGIDEKISAIDEDIMSTTDEKEKKNLEELRSKYHQVVTMLCKKTIAEAKGTPAITSLSPDELDSLKFVSINPKILLLFDDCTDQIKKLRNTKIIEKMFYQGRHNNITTIFACHTDKALDPEIKKNTYINIFCDESSASSYFSRTSAFMSEQIVTKAKTSIKSTFSVKWQKLIWVKERNLFCKYTANIHPPFTFGSDVVREFGDRVAADATKTDVNNYFELKYGRHN